MSVDNRGSYQDTRALLNSLLAQVSAESFLDDVLGKEWEMRGRLANGPNHYDHFPEPIGDEQSATQSTGLMLDDFFSEWSVLHQLPNTSSGFSATILQSKDGEIALSFRSTESLPSSLGGDFERDGGSGADGEILKKGFAFGQLLDMEKYYGQLVAGDGDWISNLDAAQKSQISSYLKNPDKQLSVTGYSLGSHMAQVFTILHPDKVVNATTFNGAGFGLLEGVEQTVSAYNVGLTTMLNNMRRYLDDPGELIKDLGRV
ncbi:hypothetical protein [Hahella ganghwensis]|uniref:hypothetical protein n=1 Tax=Hahella ganghwensis TaxID=286420 RepID=UPI0003764D57|nr:hypothetical protein [Hahella ganghwensis]